MARSTQIFGRKLADARNRLHLTQAQLGAKLDPPMTDENIGRIEREEQAGILSKRVPQLAAALGMTLEQFKKECVAPDPPPSALRVRAATVSVEVAMSRSMAAVLKNYADRQGETVDEMVSRALSRLTVEDLVGEVPPESSLTPPGTGSNRSPSTNPAAGGGPETAAGSPAATPTPRARRRSGSGGGRRRGK